MNVRKAAATLGAGRGGLSAPALMALGVALAVVVCAVWSWRWHHAALWREQEAQARAAAVSALAGLAGAEQPEASAEAALVELLNRASKHLAGQDVRTPWALDLQFGGARVQASVTSAAPAQVAGVFPPGPAGSGNAEQGENAESGLSLRREGEEALASAPVTFRGHKGELVVRARPAPGAEMVLAQELAMLAGAGVLVIVGVRRLARRDLAGVGAVRAALRRLHEGGEAGFREGSGAWRVADDLGDEARAWNRLLEERDALRARRELERVGDAGAGSAGGAGEYAAAFDSVWLGLVVLDEQGAVKLINGAAAALLHHQRAELLGRMLDETLVDKPVVDAVRGVVSGGVRQRTVVEVTRRGATEEDRAILRCTVRPMRREIGCAALLVIEDVTQQRVADESRNGFVAQATHELRTPLTTMRLYLDELVEQGDKDPLVKARCMNVLNSEVRRLERVVSDMLSVSEIEAGTLTLHTDDVRLETVFEELRQDFRAGAADKDVELSFELPPKFPALLADRDKLVMALHNIVGNAVKYTPAGGKVAVRVLDTGGALQVEVADTGIGIREEELERVFEKFYRAKDKRVAGITGSGIGLALAREVVRLHGGDITATSQIDKGSTFTLTVPLKPASSVRAAA